MITAQLLTIRVKGWVGAWLSLPSCLVQIELVCNRVSAEEQMTRETNQPSHVCVCHQNKFEEKWVNHIESKLREEAAAQQREEAETLRSLRAAAVAARGERLAAQVDSQHDLSPPRRYPSPDPRAVSSCSPNELNVIAAPRDVILPCSVCMHCEAQYNLHVGNAAMSMHSSGDGAVPFLRESHR